MTPQQIRDKVKAIHQTMAFLNQMLVDTQLECKHTIVNEVPFREDGYSERSKYLKRITCLECGKFLGIFPQ